LGVKTHTYGSYERGDNYAPINTFFVLSDFFKVSIDDMVKLDLENGEYHTLSKKELLGQQMAVRIIPQETWKNEL